MSDLGKFMSQALYYGKDKSLPEMEPKIRYEISGQQGVLD